MKALILLLLASALLTAGCRDSSGTSDFDAEWERRTRAQLDEYDRQTKRADEQQARAQARSDEQDRRYEKLLDKWEEQARRQDAILDAMEKQQGIKK